MQRASIEEVDGGIRIFTPYLPDFVEDLKTEIPYGYRRWDPERRCWRVEEPYVDDAVEIIGRYFEFVPPAREKEQASNNSHSTSECLAAVKAAYPYHAELSVWPRAAPEVIEAAWRVLAKLNHPDKGGDLSRMQRINAAHDRLAGGR